MHGQLTRLTIPPLKISSPAARTAVGVLTLSIAIGLGAWFKDSIDHGNAKNAAEAAARFLDEQAANCDLARTTTHQNTPTQAAQKLRTTTGTTIQCDILRLPNGKETGLSHNFNKPTGFGFSILHPDNTIDKLGRNSSTQTTKIILERIDANDHANRITLTLTSTGDPKITIKNQQGNQPSTAVLQDFEANPDDIQPLVEAAKAIEQSIAQLPPNQIL